MEKRKTMRLRNPTVTVLSEESRRLGNDGDYIYEG